MDESELRHCIRNLEAIGRQRQQAAGAEILEALKEIMLHSVAHNTESLLFSIIIGMLLRNREEIFSKSSAQEFKAMLVPQFLLAVNQNFRQKRTVSFYAQLANLLIPR